MKPLLISSGEPAGIGPDLCISLADYGLPIVILADPNLLEERAQELGKSISLHEYKIGDSVVTKPGYLSVLPISCSAPVKSGQLNSQNANYVIELLSQAAFLCGQGEFSALVTAPVNKAIINEKGIHFTGHTEFFEQFFQSKKVVMLLICEKMRVALVTTHLPLRKVADTISKELIIAVGTQLHQALIEDFDIKKPRIMVAGLNPHAGESGYLGCEEIEIISPAIEALKTQGLNIQGPISADTLFTPKYLNNCDAFVSMYHDQGLPVLKYAGFNQAVNVSLGLPIIRTSVDHGTALDIAGKGLADIGSMLAAVQTAKIMASNRNK